jgi:hypothetical protein
MRSLTTLAVIATLAALPACRRPSTSPTEVAAVQTAEAPVKPDDPAWRRAPVHVARLLLQDLVEPRLMEASTSEVRVQALTDGEEIAFRLAWADPANDDIGEPGRMVDSCAIQIPRVLDPNPPAPQMGEEGRVVDITFWRADWQAIVDGRGNTLRDLYPRADITHYPFEAESLEEGSPAQREMARRYAPAEAAGNLRTGPRESPVEDLVADGPGTLTPAAAQSSDGRGERTKDGWAVVIKRKIPEGLSPKARTQIAFAVWEGSHREAGSRKMRTGWIPLAVREAP